MISLSTSQANETKVVKFDFLYQLVLSM
jgi:hypothetical protein